MESGSSGCHCVAAAKAVANAKACGCSSCCDGCTAVQHGSHPALAASSLHFVFAHQRLFSPRQPEDMVAPQRRHGSPDGDGRRSLPNRVPADCTTRSPQSHTGYGDRLEDGRSNRQ